MSSKRSNKRNNMSNNKRSNNVKQGETKEAMLSKEHQEEQQE
jgi:hypothetical protein